MSLEISTSLGAEPSARPNTGASCRRAEARPRRAWFRSLAVCGVAVVLVTGGTWVSRSSALHARTIDVTGASHLSRVEAVRLAGVSRSTNILWFDEEAAARRLSADPWVASASVRGSFPWTIRIVVNERVPVGVLDDGERELIIAGDGTILGPADRGNGLPVIRIPPPGALETLPPSPAGAAGILDAMSPELRVRIHRIAVAPDSTIELWLTDGTRVWFGTGAEPGAKVRALARVLAWAQDEGELLRVVSVVAPDSPAAMVSTTP